MIFSVYIQVGMFSIVALSVLILVALLFDPVLENRIKTIFFLVITSVYSISFYPKEVKQPRVWLPHFVFALLLLVAYCAIDKNAIMENTWFSSLLLSGIQSLTKIFAG